jgi:hypothetical protein
MEIRIVTDGDAENTLIYINDVLQGTLTEFHMSVRARQKCKLQMLKFERDEMGVERACPISFYGADFKQLGKAVSGNGKIGEAIKGVK